MLALNPLVGEFDRRRFRALGRSRGNADLHDIAAAGRAFAEQLRAFIAAHPAGCRCPWCRSRADEDSRMTDDLRGLLWCVENGLGWVENALVPMPKAASADRPA